MLFIVTVSATKSIKEWLGTGKWQKIKPRGDPREPLFRYELMKSVQQFSEVLNCAEPEHSATPTPADCILNTSPLRYCWAELTQQWHQTEARSGNRFRKGRGCIYVARFEVEQSIVHQLHRKPSRPCGRFWNLMQFAHWWHHCQGLNAASASAWTDSLYLATRSRLCSEPCSPLHKLHSLRREDKVEAQISTPPKPKWCF